MISTGSWHRAIDRVTRGGPIWRAAVVALLVTLFVARALPAGSPTPRAANLSTPLAEAQAASSLAPRPLRAPFARSTRLPQVDGEVTSRPLKRQYQAIKASAQQPADLPVPPQYGRDSEPPADPGPPEPEQIPQEEIELPGHVDPLPGTTLDELAQLTLGNHPQLREAESQLAAARGRAFQASRYPNPIAGTASPQLAGNQSQYSATLTQEVVTKNKIGLDTAAAQRAARAAELNLVQARFAVLTGVRQRFYTTLAAQERVKILKSMVDVARTSYQVSQNLRDAKVGMPDDVLLLRIELSKAQAELTNAETIEATSKRQLAAATGLINLPIPHVHGDLTERLPDYELLAVQRGVLARNASVQSAQVDVSRQQFMLRRAQVEPFPNLIMMGGIQNQQPGALAPETQGIYQVQLEVPLWNRNQGNIRAAQAEVGAAMAQWRRIETDLANDVAASMGRYLSAKQFTERYEREILPSATQLQRISARLYSEKQIDFLRYLASQHTLLGTSLAYIEAQQDRWAAAAELAGMLQSETFP